MVCGGKTLPIRLQIARQKFDVHTPTISQMILTGKLDKEFVTSARIQLSDCRQCVIVLHGQEQIEIMDYEQQLKQFIEEIVQKATDVQGIVRGLKIPQIAIIKESSKVSSDTSPSNSTANLRSSTSSLDSHNTHVDDPIRSTNFDQTDTNPRVQCQLAVFVLRPGQLDSEIDTASSTIQLN